MQEMNKLGYAGHAELVDSSMFLPQRRLRAWCVFFRAGHASIVPSLAFSLCCPTEQAASLDSVLDEQDNSQPLMDKNEAIATEAAQLEVA